MQNDMRDKLKSLIDTFFCSVDIDKFYSQNQKEKLADWLRENGVIASPCNLKEEITLLNGEKRTVEYLVYDGEWHFGTEDGEFNEREIINLPIEEKALKEPSPKKAAHTPFFYNRFMKTV